MSIRHLSNDIKNCLGFETDAVVELGHRVKSQGLYLIIDAMKNIRDEVSQLSENILGKQLWNCRGAFDACPEIPSDSKERFSILENEFSEHKQIISVNSRVTGVVFITRYTAV